MVNKNIVDYIRYVNEVDLKDGTIDLSNVDIAVENCDYYIKPGRNRALFLAEFGKYMRKLSVKASTEEMGRFTLQMATLVQRYFDKDYFEYRINRANEIPNKQLLKLYLEKFNCSQILEFWGFIINARYNYDLFMSNESATHMLTTFNAMCRKKDTSIPGIWEPRYEAYIAKNPAYHFKYLSKKTIVKVFCDHIDKDTRLAGEAAREYYKFGVDAARNYVMTKLYTI